MTNTIMPKNSKIYFCIACNFKCSKNSNYIQHLATRKHNILININNKMPKMPQNLRVVVVKYTNMRHHYVSTNKNVNY